MSREKEYTLQSHDSRFPTTAMHENLAFTPFLPSSYLAYFPVTSLAHIAFFEVLTVIARAPQTAMYLQHAAARHLSVRYRFWTWDATLRRNLE
jgi:hypothetical protein